MKKIVITLTLTISVLYGTAFGAIALPLRQPSLNTTTSLCLVGSGTLIAPSQDQVCMAAPTCQSSPTSIRFQKITIPTQNIMSFLEAQGINLTLKASNIRELAQAPATQVQLMTEQLAQQVVALFEGKAEASRQISPSTWLGRQQQNLHTLIGYFTQTVLEKEIKQLASKQKRPESELWKKLGLEISYAIKQGNFDLADFQFSANEPLSSTITPTIAHATAYCEQRPTCTTMCENQHATATTRGEYASCALMHLLSQPELSKVTFNTPANAQYLQTMFSTIHHRSQVHHQDYNEFFHGFSGGFGLLFDVFTALAQQAKLTTAENPSPYFFRILGQMFNRYAPTARFFLDKIAAKTESPDYLDSTHLPNEPFKPTSELLLSTNLFLGADCEHLAHGECTLAFFLDNGFLMKDYHAVSRAYSDVNDLFRLLAIPKHYSNQIQLLYEQYPEIHVGQLAQIEIPKEITVNCVYISSRYGIPFKEEQKGFFGSSYETRPDPTTKIAQLTHAPNEGLQARIIPAPKYEQYFIVYRYYANAQAEKAAQTFHKKLQQIIEQALTENPQAIQQLKNEAFNRK